MPFPRKSRHVSKPTTRPLRLPSIRPTTHFQKLTHDRVFLFPFHSIALHLQKKTFSQLRMHLGVNDNPPISNTYSSFRPTPHVRKTKREQMGARECPFFPLSSCHPLDTLPPYKANEHTPFSPVVRARRPPIGCPTPRAAWVGWAEVSRRTVVIWGLYTRDLRTVPPLLPIPPPPYRDRSQRISNEAYTTSGRRPSSDGPLVTRHKRA